MPRKPGDSSGLAVAIAWHQTVNTAITTPNNKTFAPLRLCAFALKIFLCAAAFCAVQSAGAQSVPGPAILQELRAFDQMGSVLYVAAHPDDENTQLITYFARGRNYRTAYLSLTRGDGGQNVLGGEFGSELGYIRTEELLAARRLDGGQQFFTRAMDFGFSKDYRETLNIWDKDQVVADIVRVIRTFRPDVVVTRFSTVPGGTHGHHTASAVLALEAFKLAGDPKAFPEQLTELQPWQPKRIFVNGRGEAGGLQMDISGNDPVSGESFGAIAGRSRSMHKSQGFGNFAGGGGGGRPESFNLLAGEPATNDILDGVDTTWTRVPGGADIGKQADDIIAKFDTNNPEASVPALLKLKSALATLPADRIVDEKKKQLDHILQTCLGLEVATTMPTAEVVPGEELKLHHTVTVLSSVPVRWVATRHPAIKEELNPVPIIDLNAIKQGSRNEAITLPASTPLTQPYWLREEPGTGMFKVAEASLIGRPENPPAFPVEQVFEVGGQTLVIPGEPVQAETHRRLDVIPPVSLHFVSEVKLFAPGSTRPVAIEITAARAHSAGALKLNAPAGWKVTPASQSFDLATVGEKKSFTFTITAPAKSAGASITASAQIGNAIYGNDRTEIAYKHIPHLLLQPAARLKAVSFDLATRGKNVGYVPGAGDSVAEALAEMGYQVTSLTGADLTTNRLKDFDAIVIGIRAFNVRTDLVPQLPALFAYVEAGGTVIEQYNRPARDLPQLAPYPLHVSDKRVTDETAEVTFLAPNHAALNTPNKITSADFDGWVQERGIYFPDTWDTNFIPILGCHDPGEAQNTGSLLVAQYGKGNFVYTGLVFFRELPAGVPGAYRLFANLVSLGK
ncbi:MAG TPA: PIG-L family deacetylase [Candidatus Acidoferrales bacterium]|nr:PIG-L family deacetylase [Candidatus Acidoferrales bacterium]